ncbi:Hypothetical predicted protein [Mytilus galloprovincialis]|uniref:ATPase AAA-type core domain-containing protein n=1 Tax=Mytilus galloprovincialis TaxID=29158 RepID=A0A8B6G0Z3_MYTGA|nr:Hypothetical predicted protein [Mytilus galloprovincialis]
MYKNSTILAYVIKTYLNDPDEGTTDGSESHYFRCLTEPQSYKFEFKDNTDKTEIFVTCNNDDKPFPILKTPEGILEAKIMFITLSYEIPTTLLIDEPGRGMHPSMIDCLRDLVLYDVNKNRAKTVIFTTHNQRFICPWTFENIFYFYSCESGSEIVHLGNEIQDDKKEYLWSDQVSPILLSKRVIMVEGVDAIRFLSTLKNVLLTGEIRRKLVCKEDPETDHQLRKFLISLHIIAMGGKGSAKGIEPLCQALNLTQRKLRYYMYLFDSDALKTIKSFLMKTELNKSDIEDQNVGKLEEHGIFVWFGYTDGIVEKFEKLSVIDLANYGRLEDAILGFCNTHDKIHHEQNNRNCTLRDCKGMDIFLKDLGKDDADNRNPNKKKPIELKKHRLLAIKRAH